MQSEISKIADGFNQRAASYAANDWHRRCAQRLVELCKPQPAERVLDAGTGTGFAAIAAAPAVGPDGHVLAIDIASAMLHEAHAAVIAMGLKNVSFREGDATRLPDLADESFDLVVCAAALLYMPVAAALREWNRLLKKDGRVAFSTMCTGSPPAGRIFRDCALAFGVSLSDPSAALGSVTASRAVLTAAGFETISVVRETIKFTPQDLALAWDSNFRSAAHREVQCLSAETQQTFKSAYLKALQDAEKAGALNDANLLYVVGRKRSRRMRDE